MQFELLLTVFIMGVGLSVSGAATHLYQMFAKERAMLRYDGNSYLASLGHLAMSFVCGPFIMLQLGWQTEDGDTVSISSMLLASFVAFGWAFISGLLFLGIFFAIVG